ncbi:MAG: RNA polymerase sigma factor [Nocardioides sp.]|uniref:RNA polymerase sigma factor n=1 Tax=Nocardioides sp. TaxID=35761 RepID=UPI003EFF5AA8
MENVDDAPGSRELTDAEVLDLARERPEQLGILFDRYAPELLRHLTRRVGAADAEDVLADVFVVALERRESYDPSAPSARPWLYGIATNLLHRRRRAQARHLRALARMSPEDRDVVLLVAWGDLSQPEVAAALGIPAGTVKSRLHRARRVLRAHLAADGTPARLPRPSDRLAVVTSNGDDL